MKNTSNAENEISKLSKLYLKFNTLVVPLNELENIEAKVMSEISGFVKLHVTVIICR